MKTIKLSNGRGETIVSDDTYKKIHIYKWHKTKSGYVCNNKLGLLHRYIMNCPDDKIVDHINRIRHDNRKENLRVCTQSENGKNKSPKGKSPYYNIDNASVNIEKEVWEEFKKYCDSYGYRYAGKLSEVVKNFLDSKKEKK